MTSYISTTAPSGGWSISHQVPTTPPPQPTITSSVTFPVASVGETEVCDAGWSRPGEGTCDDTAWQRPGEGECNEPGWDRNTPGMCLQPEWQMNVNIPKCRPDICRIIARDESNIRTNKYFSHLDRLKECNITRVRTGLNLPPWKRNRPCTVKPIFRTQLDRVRFMRNNLQKIADQSKIACDPYIFRHCGCVCEPEPVCPPCGGVYREPLQLGVGGCGCGGSS